MTAYSKAMLRASFSSIHRSELLRLAKVIATKLHQADVPLSLHASETAFLQELKMGAAFTNVLVRVPASQQIYRIR